MAKTKETEVTPETEETTEETQPTEEQTETQPEDLQAQVDAARAEAAQNLELYKDSQRKESRIAERERKQDILDTIPSLRQDIADNRELTETMATFIEQRLGASEYTEQPPAQRSPFAELRQRQEDRRKQPSEPKKEPEPKPEVDLEELEARAISMGIIKGMDWDENHPVVKKAYALESGKEAQKLLQKEQKAQQDKESDERLQKALKDAGVTTPETGGPSAASRTFAQIEQRYADGLISTAEYTKALKERK